MGSQVIPDSQVTLDIRLAAFFEDMDMVSAFIPAFGVESPAGDTELTPAVITKSLKFGIMGIYERDVLYHGHDINDRLGGKFSDGGASDMVDGNAVFPRIFRISFSSSLNIFSHSGR